MTWIKHLLLPVRLRMLHFPVLGAMLLLPSKPCLTQAPVAGGESALAHNPHRPLKQHVQVQLLAVP
jgi:hypothetical protein